VLIVLRLIFLTSEPILQQGLLFVKEKMKMSKTFKEFMLEEGIRQDALIHNVSGQLGTKTGLYMVFAAFVFTAESTLASTGSAIGWQPLKVALWAATIFSLAGIAVLLRSAFLEKYEMPPILPRLAEQSQKFFELPDIKNLPEEQKMAEFQGKFVNSLSRSIKANFSANDKISRNLEWASWLIAASVGSLFVSLAWFPASHVLFYLNRW
jgi:hypothetical protein